MRWFLLLGLLGIALGGHDDHHDPHHTPPTPRHPSLPPTQHTHLPPHNHGTDSPPPPNHHSHPPATTKGPVVKASTPRHPSLPPHDHTTKKPERPVICGAPKIMLNGGVNSFELLTLQPGTNGPFITKNPANCEWVVKAPVGFRVYVTFEAFFLKMKNVFEVFAGETAMESNLLARWPDQKEEQPVLYGRALGKDDVFPFYTPSNVLLLRLTQNDLTPSVAFRIRLSVSSQPEYGPYGYQASRGLLYSPNYPMPSGKLPFMTQYSIRTATGTRVSLEIQRLDLSPNDVLTIIEGGESGQGQVLMRLTGSSNVIVTGPIVSGTQMMLVTYLSQGGSGIGFRATYSSVTPVSTVSTAAPTATQKVGTVGTSSSAAPSSIPIATLIPPEINNSSCHFDIDASNFHGGFDAVNISGSPGNPAYCTWDIRGKPGSWIDLMFRNLNLIPHKDFLAVYTGENSLVSILNDHEFYNRSKGGKECWQNPGVMYETIVPSSHVRVRLQTTRSFSMLPRTRFQGVYNEILLNSDQQHNFSLSLNGKTGVVMSPGYPNFYSPTRFPYSFTYEIRGTGNCMDPNGTYSINLHVMSNTQQGSCRVDVRDNQRVMQLPSGMTHVTVNSEGVDEEMNVTFTCREPEGAHSAVEGEAGVAEPQPSSFRFIASYDVHRRNPTTPPPPTPHHHHHHDDPMEIPGVAFPWGIVAVVLLSLGVFLVCTTTFFLCLRAGGPPAVSARMRQARKLRMIQKTNPSYRTMYSVPSNPTHIVPVATLEKILESPEEEQKA